MINFIKFSRMLRQLTFKSVESTDEMLVVTERGIPQKIKVSDFKGVSLVFAHISFDGSDSSTISSYNVDKLTRLSEGVFKIEFANPHATGKYTAVATAGFGNHTSSGRSVSIDEYTTDSVTIRVERTDTGSQQDEEYVALAVLG